MSHKYEIRLKGDGYRLHVASSEGVFHDSCYFGPFRTLDEAEAAWMKEASNKVWKYDDRFQVE